MKPWEMHKIGEIFVPFAAGGAGSALHCGGHLVVYPGPAAGRAAVSVKRQRRPSGAVYHRRQRPAGRYDEIYTRLLPEGDALALQQGVPITDERELQKRLEDYGL